MDPIVDMFNRIRNASAVLHPTVDMPFSDLKHKLAKILEKEGFVGKIEKRGRKTGRVLGIALKYNEDKTPAISGLRRISKQGRRMYLPVKKIKRVKDGYGIAIISTPKGLMTDREARKQRLGGEIICEVW